MSGFFHALIASVGLNPGQILPATRKDGTGDCPVMSGFFHAHNTTDERGDMIARLCRAFFMHIGTETEVHKHSCDCPVMLGFFHTQEKVNQTQEDP